MSFIIRPMSNPRYKLLLTLFTIFMITQFALTDARGKKKKRGSAQSCSMDCSATCCLDIACATDIADCAGYVNREFYEIYVGVITLVCLLIGIPVTIWFLNCCLMYRFCQHEDEENDTKTGGFTICEIFPKFLCCCFFRKRVQKSVEDEEDEENEFKGNENSGNKQKVLNAEVTQKTHNGEGKQDKQRHLSPHGSNDDIKNTNRSSQDEDDYSKSKRDNQHSKNKAKSPRRYKNGCVRCMCIVFCCADSNINGVDEKNNEDGQELLHSGEEEIGFGGSNGGSPVKNQGINSKNHSKTIDKIEIDMDQNDEEDNGDDQNGVEDLDDQGDE
eukprot:403340765